MKKLLIASCSFLFLLTGCDMSAMDTLSCSYTNTANNLTTKVSYDIDYQDDEVKKVRITYNYDQADNNDVNGNNDTTNDNGIDANNIDGTNDNDNNGVNNNGVNGTNGNGNDVAGNNDVNGTNDNNARTNDVDGVNTGTDGTTNDSQLDEDGIIDGVVGNAIDAIVNGVTTVILDVSGVRDRHATVQNTYGNIPGFSVQNTTDTDNSYKVTYVIDYDTISDDDLATLNLSRNLDTLKSNYLSQGYTCE